MSANGTSIDGIKIRHILHETGFEVSRIAWSPDGQLLASNRRNRDNDINTLQLWDITSKELQIGIEEFSEHIYSLAWSPDGQTLAVGLSNGKIKLFDRGAKLLSLAVEEHPKPVSDLAWSLDGQILASSTQDRTVWLWDTKTWEIYRTLKSSSLVYDLAWSPDNQILAGACQDSTIRFWNVETGKLDRRLKGHSNAVSRLAWLPNKPILASGGNDTTVRLWNTETGQQKAVLEGHIQSVHQLSFSFDGCILTSKSIFGQIQLWCCDTYELIGIFNESKKNFCSFPVLAFHPALPVLATSGEDGGICLWDLDLDVLLNNSPITPSVHYVNAKAVLVGESGVGKSGLGIRIAEKKFRTTESTHGAQFWQIPVTEQVELVSNASEVKAELTLWDLAGQPDYHLVHQLFLDDTDVALLLFDCSDAAEPFRGVHYWAKVLKKLAPANALKYLVCNTKLTQTE